jgi:hypothetical protein
MLALVTVAGAETCPTIDDVERRVRAILHLRPEQELSERFVVERHEAALFVELRSADAALIGQRTLPLEGNCDELAEAAAVVLSAWLTDVHPDFATALPMPEPEPQVPPELPVPVPVAEPPVPKAEAPPASRPAPPKPAPRFMPHGVELSLGAGADWQGRKFAASAMVSAAFAPNAGGLGAFIWAALDTSRRESLGGGSVSWRRWPIGVGPSYRWQASRLRFDVSLGPALAWLRVRGVGFAPNYSQHAATWAGFGSVRLASRGRTGIFALVNTVFYFGDSIAYAAAAEYRLPPVSLSLFVGATASP